MNKTVSARLIQQVFEPTPRGVVGLAEDLLALCNDDGLAMEWQDDRCRVRWLTDVQDHFVDIQIPRSVFRTLLARIAALCNEHRPNSVSPYGGQGELLVAADGQLVQATFTNTPDEQRLALKPASPADAGHIPT